MPVVLMSAKSDRIREHFVQQTGAIDAITKPFDAQALIAVIENAIRRSEAWRARGEALAAGIPDDFEAPESLRSTGDSDSQARARRGRGAQTPLGRARAGARQAAARRCRQRGAARPSSCSDSSRADQVSALAEPIRGIDLGVPHRAVGRHLHHSHRRRAPAASDRGADRALHVTDGKTEVTVAMREGLIDLVQARGAGDEFRLGRYFVELGLVTPDDIDRLLRDNAPDAAPAARPRDPSRRGRRRATR